MRLFASTFFILVAGMCLGAIEEYGGAGTGHGTDQTINIDNPNAEMNSFADSLATPVLHLPVEGTWRLIRSPGHHRYAFDLVAVDETSRRSMRRSRLLHVLGRVRVEDAFGWGKPVLAPITGTVVQAAQDQQDRKRLSMLRDLWSMVVSSPAVKQDDISAMGGNHVIIRGEGFYVFLAHLKRDSVSVEKGDEVEMGDVIGLVGNSGHSLVPHLHLEVFDQIDDLLSANTLPFVIAEYEGWRGRKWLDVQNEVLKKGEVIRSPVLD